MANYLAIDLMRTKLKYAYISDSLDIYEMGNEYIPIDSKEELFDVILSVTDRYRDDIEGVSITMPGVIDRKRGHAYSGGVFLWVKDMDYAQELSEYIEMPVTICNDAKAAALAELGFGNLKDIRNGVAIILGTGIGGAVVIDGKLLDGSHYSSGEFSFIREDIHERGRGKDMFAFTNGVQGLKDAIKAASGLDDIDGLKAFKLIKEEHNEQVLQGVKDFCWYLAFHIYNLQSIIDANRFVIGGGISNEPMFIELVQEAVQEKFATALAPAIPMPEIMVCRYQSDANLVGAVFNFMQIVEGIEYVS